MKLKQIFSALTAGIFLFASINFTAFAANEITLSEFIENVKNSGGTYDGDGVVVKWSNTDFKPSSGHQANGTVAQYYGLFGETDGWDPIDINTLNISNVNFVFEPVANDENYPNSNFTTAEFQLYSTGDITFTDCTFDKVTLDPWGINDDECDTVTITGCTFKNIENRYALHQVRASSVIIEGCTFDNCSAAAHINPTNSDVETILITGNTFTNTGNDERGIICFAEGGRADGIWANADITLTQNSSDTSAPVLRVLNDVPDIVYENNSLPTGTSVTTENSILKLEEIDGKLVVPIDWTADVIKIGTAKELADFASYVNSGNSFSGKIIELEDNIDLNNENWTPIGRVGTPFSGVFDGKDFTICNLFIDRNSESNIGLFGYTTGGEIKNFTLQNVNVLGYLEVGAVAGTPYTAEYSNIDVTGDIIVKGFSYVGGAFGKNVYNNITNVDVTAEDGSYVEAKSTEADLAYRTYVGGLVGYMGEGNQIIDGCDVKIDVIGDVSNIGGIVGILHYQNIMRNCTYEGNLHLTDPDAGSSDEFGVFAGTVYISADYAVPVISDCSATVLSAMLGNKDITDTITPHGDEYGDSKAQFFEITSASNVVINGKTATVNNAVASYNGKAYITLTEALNDAAFASSDAVIELIDDVLLKFENEKINTITVNSSSDKTITINGNGYKIDSGVKNSGIDGSLYCGKIVVNGADISVNNTVFPNDMLFDSNGGTVTIDNCVFCGSQTGYPQALKAVYTNNHFEPNNADDLDNAYPLWYKIQHDMELIFNNNTVVANRVVNLEARNQSAVNVEMRSNDMTVNNSTADKSVAVQVLTFGENCGLEFVGNTLKGNGTAAICIYNPTEETIKFTIEADGNILQNASSLIGYNTWSYTPGSPEDTLAAELIKQAIENVKRPSSFTDSITVSFEEAGSGLYNIVLKPESGKYINRLTSAEFSFSNLSSGISYSIVPVDGVRVVSDAENHYLFYFSDEDSGLREKIVIAKVQFEGYGAVDFKIDETGINFVNPTSSVNNLVDTFVPGGSIDEGEGDLIINDADNNGVINTELEQEKNTLTVDILFPNTISDNEASYQDMKAVISGGDLSEDITYTFGSGNIELTDEKYSFSTELTEGISYTVTISGAGYRTARYTVNMSGDKTLTFWNNVMDDAMAIEEGEETSKTKTSFLAGDIVRDNQINIYDLSAVVSYFGTDNLVEDHPEYAKYDLNRDGRIDSKDVAYVLVSWGN